MDSVLLAVADDCLPIRHAIRELLEPDVTTPLGQLLDQVIVLITNAGLFDQYMGSILDSETDALSLYFSDSAKETALQDLISTITQAEGFESTDAILTTSDEAEAAWCIALRAAREVPSPDLSGTAGVAVPLDGHISVSGPNTKPPTGKPAANDASSATIPVKRAPTGGSV